MDKNSKLVSYIIGGLIMLGAISGCVCTEQGQGIEPLEQMSEAEFGRWQLYIQLATKVGATRLLESGSVTATELTLIAKGLEQLRDNPVSTSATSIIREYLDETGLSNDEIGLLLLVIEQELIARGALEWVDPETGIIALSPRTKTILTVIINSLRSAGEVSTEESAHATELEAEFNGKIL